MPGTVNEIENPNPATGTNNWYTEDGYGNGFNAGFPPPYTASPVSGGGSYTDCADTTQPGVKPIVNYLKSLPRPIDPRCEAGHYYLLNNYNPGYFGNGKNAYTDKNPANTPFTIPPSTDPSIGDSLNDRKHLLEVLRRPVEQLRQRSLSAELRHDRTDGRRVLQHLQSVPVRHVDHVESGSGRTRTSRTR